MLSGFSPTRWMSPQPTSLDSVRCHSPTSSQTCGELLGQEEGTRSPLRRHRDRKRPQLDLVDALTTPAVRDGEQRLCTLRVALAITPTYWDEQAPETLATRISAWGGSMYSLDVPANQTDIAPDLIGRYLNAARLNVASLQGRHASVSTAVPNACDDCPFDRRDTCHALFGATEAGHGLFPLTTAAAVTTARLANRRHFGRGWCSRTSWAQSLRSGRG